MSALTSASSLSSLAVVPCGLPMASLMGCVETSPWLVGAPPMQGGGADPGGWEALLCTSSSFVAAWSVPETFQVSGLSRGLNILLSR